MAAQMPRVTSQTRPGLSDDSAAGRLAGSTAGTVRGIRLAAAGVCRQVRGKRVLRDVSLSIAPGGLVAVIGSSGAGKTMLLETLAGVRSPDAGTVTYDGAPWQAGHRGPLRRCLGYVPQDDIIHPELPLRRTLEYAARLRLPTGAGAQSPSEAAAGVLDVLGLAGRADVAVGALSGGERKRASIGVELLTAPRLFLLDEPTSGLDPVNAGSVVALLRRLADDGTTVVLTTHNVPDLEACDRVVFLAGDGSVAFTGSPAQAREHFGTPRLELAYQQLGSSAEPVTGTPATTGPAATHRLPEPAATHRLPEPAAAPAEAPSAARSGPGAVRQWYLLTRRSADILARNKLTLAILLGSPAMVVLMFVVLFRPNAFSFTHPSPNATLMTIFWIAFGGFFFGLSYGLPQICGEFAVLRREHHIGIGLAPYVLSKLTVLAPLLAAVDAATLAVLRGLGRLPAAGAAQTGSEFATLALASAAALGLGLLTSAAVSGPSQAIVAMPMLCFPQVLFSGAFLPVPAMAAAGRVISYAMTNRWAFEGLGHSAGLPRLWAGGGSPLGPPLLASYGATFSRSAVADWVILSGFTAVLLAATYAVLVARCGGTGWRLPGRRRSPASPADAVAGGEGA